MRRSLSTHCCSWLGHAGLCSLSRTANLRSELAVSRRGNHPLCSAHRGGQQRGVLVVQQVDGVAAPAVHPAGLEEERVRAAPRVVQPRQPRHAPARAQHRALRRQEPARRGALPLISTERVLHVPERTAAATRRGAAGAEHVAEHVLKSHWLTGKAQPPAASQAGSLLCRHGSKPTSCPKTTLSLGRVAWNAGRAASSVRARACQCAHCGPRRRRALLPGRAPRRLPRTRPRFP